MRRTTALYILLTALWASTSWLHAARGTSQQPKAILRILSDPPGATVFIDYHNSGTTPLEITDIAPGKHLVEIKKARYDSWLGTTTATAGERTNVEAKLERTKGLLLVKTEPKGATVKVNGIDRGQSPLLITDLDTGSYRVQLSLPSYISKEIQVKLPDKRPRLVNISLLSDFGTLMIESTPPGAEVTLNGINQGTTPTTIDRIPAGEAKVEIFADGFKRYSETIRLAAGESQTMNCELQPVPATLRVVSIPLQARVYVNNQFKGNAPVFLDDLVPGEYRIRTELPNHDPVARTINIKRADRLVEEFRLKPNTGAVKITTEPAGVEVLIDGSFEALTKSKFDSTDNVSEVLTLEKVRSGERKFSFVHKDYFSREEEITVTRDDTVTIHIKLERRFIPNLEVRTQSSVYTGVYKGLDINGKIILEIRPGITRNFSQNEVVSTRPIKQAEPDKISP
jgi:hypothetical protein